jgi:hypothetical protein
MKYGRIIDNILIVFFVFSISIPLLRSNFIGGMISSTENRILASFPRLKDSNGKFDNEFRGKFETWLNDNIGFRNRFFNIKYFIDLTFFQSTYPNEKIGKDKWLFLLPPENIRRAQNNDLYTSDQMTFFANRFTEITSYYKTMGIEFCMMAFPHKLQIYSEYLPDTILKVNEKSAIEHAKENLEKNPNFDFQVSIQPFIDAKESMLICSKAVDNAHWNNYGAFIGYTLLMNQVKEHIEDIRILTEDDFNIIPFERNTYRAGKLFTSEIDYKFEFKKPISAESKKSYLFELGFQSIDRYKSYNFYMNKDGSLPKAIIIGDSYIWMFMLPQLAESFSRMAFINVTDISQLPNLVSRIKPDIIICTGLLHQVLSSYNIKLGTNSDPTISEANTSVFAEKKEDGYEVYSTYGDSPKLEIFISNDKVININLDDYKILQGLEVKPGNTYITNGDDAYIYYELNKYINPDYCLLEFEKIPEDIMMEILYTHGDDYWNDYGVKHFIIDGGLDNSYLLKFDENRSINRIRLSFRNIPGREFKIKNVYIFEK